MRDPGPLEVAPGALVHSSFHGEDGAPFLVIVNSLVLASEAGGSGGAVPACTDLFLPELGLYWTPERFYTPVRHPVVVAEDLDDGYWEQVVAMWAGCDLEDVRRLAPSVVVPAHGVVLRGRRLAEALDPSAAARGATPLATYQEVNEALAALRLRHGGADGRGNGVGPAHQQGDVGGLGEGAGLVHQGEDVLAR